MFSDKTMIEKINNDLKQAILSQSELPPIILGNIREQLREKIDPSMARALKKIYITGCGDSYFTGVGVEHAFLKFTGVDTQPVEPLNYSRYIVDYMPEHSALIPISNSGKVSRTIEAARCAKGRARTWAITDNPEGGLAQNCDQAFYPGVPPFPSVATGTRSYLATLLSAYALAIHLGSLRSTIDANTTEKLYSMLSGIGDGIEKTIQLSSDAVRTYVVDSQEDAIFIIGGGPNYGTAMFGAAKLLEALSIDGIAIELEEWAHLQFHTTFENTPNILIAPPGESYDRAVEQAKGIIDSGGKLTAIVDEDDQEISRMAHTSFRVASPQEEAFSPLIYCLPLELLSVELAIHRQRAIVMLLDENKKEINFRQIYHSKIKG